MFWAWMLWSRHALRTRTEVCFGHGCSCHRMFLEHERNYADALVTACSWNTNGIMLWAWMLWSPYALGTRTDICFGHGCSGHRMLLEHERNYALGMDALVTACSWNTNGIMLWAWMLWSPCALGTRTELCLGHGCSGHRMLFNTNGKPTTVSLKKRAFRWTEKSPDGCYCYYYYYYYYITTTIPTTTTTSTTTTTTATATATATATTETRKDNDVPPKSGRSREQF